MVCRNHPEDQIKTSWFQLVQWDVLVILYVLGTLLRTASPEELHVEQILTKKKK